MDIVFLEFFLAIIAFILILDLVFLNKFLTKLSYIIYISLFYIGIAIIFGCFIFLKDAKLGVEFFTGYLTEKTLSIDNLFVIKIIFDHFKIPQAKEHLILFIGILSAIILRGLMILLSTELIHKFSWVLDAFAVFLIFTAIKLMMGLTKKSHLPHSYDLKIFNFMKFANNTEKFFIKVDGKWMPTSLFMALMGIEIMDIIFALDSIPAIFAITNNTTIVYTSNIFAILGLRSLYSLISKISDNFYYIKHAMILILLFIGIKVILSKYFSINPLASLIAIITILSISIALSYKKNIQK